MRCFKCVAALRASKDIGGNHENTSFSLAVREKQFRDPGGTTRPWHHSLRPLAPTSAAESRGRILRDPSSGCGVEFRE